MHRAAPPATAPLTTMLASSLLRGALLLCCGSLLAARAARLVTSRPAVPPACDRLSSPTRLPALPCSTFYRLHTPILIPLILPTHLSMRVRVARAVPLPALPAFSCLARPPRRLELPT